MRQLPQLFQTQLCQFLFRLLIQLQILFVPLNISQVILQLRRTLGVLIMAQQMDIGPMLFSLAYVSEDFTKIIPYLQRSNDAENQLLRTQIGHVSKSYLYRNRVFEVQYFSVIS